MLSPTVSYILELRCIVQYTHVPNETISLIAWKTPTHYSPQLTSLLYWEELLEAVGRINNTLLCVPVARSSYLALSFNHNLLSFLTFPEFPSPGL